MYAPHPRADFAVADLILALQILVTRDGGARCLSRRVEAIVGIRRSFVRMRADASL